MVRTSIPVALVNRAVGGQLTRADVPLLERQDGHDLVWLGGEVDALRARGVAAAGACFCLGSMLLFAWTVGLVSWPGTWAVLGCLAWGAVKAVRHTLALSRSLMLCQVATRRKDARAARRSGLARGMAAGRPLRRL